MTKLPLDAISEALRARGVAITPGLSVEELDAIESDLHFRLPRDLRELLAAFLPRGEGFPDWRAPRSEQMLEWLDEPAAAIEFDIEDNGVWRPAWGARPEDIDDAIDQVHSLISRAPVLIPLHGHRYLPAGPGEGAPVLSVEGSDVAVIASNLPWWFHREWGSPKPDESEPQPVRVEFWTDLTE